MTPPSPSFSFGNSDTERTTSCWHSPRLLLRFPDENEEAAWPEEEMICADSVESSSHMISMSESSPALIEGVHTPYADGEYEYEYFLSHYIEGEKISRKRSIEALKNMNAMELYVAQDLRDHPTRRIGAVENYLWWDEIRLDIHSVRFRVLKEDLDNEYRAPLPVFSLSQFEAPEAFKTPVRTPAADGADDHESCDREEGRVASRSNVGYHTPRADPDSQPGRELSETPKKRASYLRRSGNFNETLEKVD
ncbi:hypothetical protein PRIPAC_96141 [Pristionchus pacificus]|uniref:Uncharacterized protein n=1 Tax=Pristionchus pacificus TaxID=54126 RepID=A0A2A6D257_PRIPA|nr:hypothetical protein PRIPAC_96141 [Pristionchus pacificus]|eukprot:PDM84363.1 hypothetical protein PRIPAC_33386 [Pristionchus pacificus]